MKNLEDLAGETLAKPPPREIAAIADHVRASHRGVEAVLAYGSCLRGVSAADSLIDLYVLTRDLSGASTNPLSRLGCLMAPPNVYYAECDFGSDKLRAKYAVLPLSVFAKWMKADNPYFWARFSQPSAIVYAASDQARDETIAAIAQALRTMYANARGLASTSDPLEIWTAGYRATYGSELRAETSNRAAALTEANASYYREAAALLADIQPIAANWRFRSLKGKLWSVARLIKASFTFAGGADYLAWKIERHSGHKIELTPWQRRHPIVAGVILLPQLLKRGAVR